MDRLIHLPHQAPDRINAIGIWRLEKFLAKSRKSGRDLVDAEPFDVLEFHNAIVNGGIDLILNLLIGAGGTVFSNANAYIGVGDSSTAVAVSQTDLQAASNKLRKAMAATYPSLASHIMTWQSVFATTDANWAWNEIALFNASAAGTMFNRALVSSPFTKTSALSITASLTYTLS